MLLKLLLDTWRAGARNNGREGAWEDGRREDGMLFLVLMLDRNNNNKKLDENNYTIKNVK